MTMEQLLEQSADELDTYSDKQLLDWFTPLLVVTRPELAPKPEKHIGKREIVKREFNNKKALAQEIMKQHGLDVRW